MKLIHVFYFSQRSYMEQKGWDVFRVLPPEQDSRKILTHHFNNYNYSET